MNQHVELKPPRSLAANIVPNGVPYVVYAAQAEGNVVVLRWKNSFEDDSTWQPWSCLDTVPHVAQLAANNIYDNAPFNTPELYATSENGQLFVRRFFASGWAPWEQLGLPRIGSHAVDVATTSTRTSLAYIYLLDEGRVFTRHHVAIDAYSNYSPWTEIKGVPAGASRICASSPADGGQRLIVSTDAGAVFLAIKADATSRFGPFVGLETPGSPAMSDVDCGTRKDGSLAIIALSQGSVWLWTGNAPGPGEWLSEMAGLDLKLTTFTVGSREGVAPTILATDADRVLRWHVLGSATWSAID